MNTHRNIILVDMDGVIADQHLGFLNIIAAQYPEIMGHYSGEDLHYEFEQNFPKEHHALIKSLRNKEGFFRDLPIIPGAKEALTAMHERGDDVYICTAPIWEYHYCVPEKFAWIEKHLGHDWTMRILTARDKTVVSGTFLIDDKEDVTGAHIPSWEHIVYDRPYNKDAPDKRRLDWGNWNEVLKS
jgi:5'-nucleotidase